MSLKLCKNEWRDFKQSLVKLIFHLSLEDWNEGLVIVENCDIWFIISYANVELSIGENQKYASVETEYFEKSFQILSWKTEGISHSILRIGGNLIDW